MQEYINIFIDSLYPKFIDKYLKTKTLNRLKYVTQFCGCDYTKLYSPLFLYTRYHHSLVVAHMTWHFTHDKNSTIAALLHDVGTPCFAHTIDYVFGDYINQESSEKNIIDVIKKDKELLKCLEEDEIILKDLNDLTKYEILENKSPRLCTDRLDGVLHTCYIWLHTHKLEEIEKVYNDLTILINEDGKKEIGFQSAEVALQFVQMVQNYATALQKNENKYTMKYISELIKKAVEENILTINDLYKKKESEIVSILEKTFSSWCFFNEAEVVIKTNRKPKQFFVSLDTKKRNVVPLIFSKSENKRINIVLKKAQDIYNFINSFQDMKYYYIKEIEKI